MSAGVVVGTYAEGIVSQEKIHFGDREKSYTRVFIQRHQYTMRKYSLGIGIKPAAFIIDFKLTCEFLISSIQFSMSRRH